MTQVVDSFLNVGTIPEWLYILMEAIALSVSIDQEDGNERVAAICLSFSSILMISAEYIIISLITG